MSLTCDQSNVSAGSRISHTLQKSDFPLRRIIPDVFGGTTKIELDMTITQGESGNASSSVFHSVVGDTFTCGYSSNEVGKKAAYPLESESCTFIDPSGDLVTLEWRVTEVDNPDFEAVPDFNDETFRIEHTKSGMEYSRIYKVRVPISTNTYVV
jgi:hypothetical protein